MQDIVIVDDRVTNRNVLAKLASEIEDVNAISFADAQEALAWASYNTPDLIITDYRMPDMDGAEFTRRLRQFQNCIDVPIIVVTIYEDRSYRYHALEAGATDFLLSPFDHYEFRVRVRNLLTISRQQKIIKNRCYSLEHTLRKTHFEYAADKQADRQKLIDILNAVPAMISATDPDGRYVLINAMQCNFFGISARDAFLKKPAEVLGKELGERHEALDRQVMRTGEEVDAFEEDAWDSEGRLHNLLTRKVPLRDRERNVMDVVTVAADITSLKQAEAEMVNAIREAEKSNAAKTTFLANMSHELRTPLNAILGFGQMINMEMLGPIGDDRYVGYASDIMSSASHLVSLIDDLLDVTQIETGKMNVADEVVDVSSLAHAAVHLVEARAREGSVRLDLELDDDLPRLRGDRTRLNQILINLLINGIKFTPAGGAVALSVTNTEDGGLMFVISDSGIGIAAEDLPIALERFGRVAKTDRPNSSGTGLGLPLSIDLVKLHGGEFYIDSRENEGTQISIVFPPSRVVSYGDTAAGSAL